MFLLGKDGGKRFLKENSSGSNQNLDSFFSCACTFSLSGELLPIGMLPTLKIIKCRVEIGT